jgi:hypothetical protein
MTACLPAPTATLGAAVADLILIDARGDLAFYAVADSAREDDVRAALVSTRRSSLT